MLPTISISLMFVFCQTEIIHNAMFMKTVSLRRYGNDCHCWDVWPVRDC